MIFGIESGDEVTPYYDSMIAKVIVWDETRIRAIQKMRKTLQDTVIFGVKTNIPYLLAILEHSEFVSGEMTTQFINKYFPQGLKLNQEVSLDIIEKLKSEVMSGGSVEESSLKTNFKKVRGPRMFGAEHEEIFLEVDGQWQWVWAERIGNEFWFHCNGNTHNVEFKSKTSRRGGIQSLSNLVKLRHLCLVKL